MESVYILLITWNRKGDCGYELKVCDSEETAQKLLTKEVCADLKEFKNIDGLLGKEFDFEQAADNNIPCPTVHLTLYNDDNLYDSEDYVEYCINKYPVLCI